MVQQLLLDEDVREFRLTQAVAVPIPEAPPVRESWWKEFLRRVANILVSTVVLAVMSPFLLVVGMLIRLESPGPIFYRGLRVGRNGRLFTMFKLRTLKVGAEKEIGVAFARLDAPYATRLGRWLRQTKADELPQFFNVLRGDMSLVGPRPVRPICAEHFGQRLPGYSEQFRVRPGITGLSQLKAGDHAHASLKLKYDLEYLQRKSLGADLTILALTGTKVMGIQLRLMARQLGNLVGPTDLLSRAHEAGDGGRRLPRSKGDADARES